MHRFVTAGVAVRYRALWRHAVSEIAALDVALPRNATDRFGSRPEALAGEVVGILRYGHFLSHVFHRDYLVVADADPASIKRRPLAVLYAEGAKYPAEHNVGRQYRAKPALANFYRRLHPTNRLNPGVGDTPTEPNWAIVPKSFAPHQGDTA